MILQEIEGYKFEVKLAWIDHEQLQLKILRTIGTETRNQDFYFHPQELSRLADYINDRLCL